MLMEMAGSRSCRGSAFHKDGPDEQNAGIDGVTRCDNMLILNDSCVSCEWIFMLLYFFMRIMRCFIFLSMHANCDYCTLCTNT